MSLSYFGKLLSICRKVSIIRNLIWNLTALALFPLMPTISDTENRPLVLITEFIGILIFQVFYHNQLESSRLLSINLWCTFMIKTLLAISELFSLQAPTIVIYLSWGCLVLTFLVPFYESVSKKLKLHANLKKEKSKRFLIWNGFFLKVKLFPIKATIR